VKEGEWPAAAVRGSHDIGGSRGLARSDSLPVGQLADMERGKKKGKKKDKTTGNKVPGCPKLT
jgi:hypothetical protein